jgi:hypothetical protein
MASDETSRSADAPLPALRFEDGLGQRLAAQDPFGEPIEQLRLCTDLAALEPAIRERIGRLINFRHARYVRLRGSERLPGPEKHVVIAYDAVQGARLAQLLDLAVDGGLRMDIDVALAVVRELLPAIAVLHDSRNVTHGAIGPERLVLTPQGRLIIVDHGLALALAKTGYSRRKFWQQLRVAVPPGSGKVAFDARTDVVQIGLVALALVLGRPIDRDEYPQDLGKLIDSARETSAKGQQRPLAPDLRAWLERALPTEHKAPFSTVREAQQAFEALFSGKRTSAGAAALKSLVARYEALGRGETPDTPVARGPAQPVPADVRVAEAALAELRARTKAAAPPPSSAPAVVRPAVAPSSTAPSSSVSSSAAPSSTVPSSTVPGSAAPSSSAPPSAVPQSAPPQSTVPQSTVARSAVSPSAAPPRATTPSPAAPSRIELSRVEPPQVERPSRGPSALDVDVARKSVEGEGDGRNSGASVSTSPRASSSTSAAGGGGVDAGKPSRGQSSPRAPERDAFAALRDLEAHLTGQADAEDASLAEPIFEPDVPLAAAPDPDAVFAKTPPPVETPQQRSTPASAPAATTSRPTAPPATTSIAPAPAAPGSDAKAAPAPTARASGSKAAPASPDVASDAKGAPAPAARALDAKAAPTQPALTSDATAAAVPAAPASDVKGVPAPAALAPDVKAAPAPAASASDMKAAPAVTAKAPPPAKPIPASVAGSTPDAANAAPPAVTAAPASSAPLSATSRAGVSEDAIVAARTTAPEAELTQFEQTAADTYEDAASSLTAARARTPEPPARPSASRKVPAIDAKAILQLTAVDDETALEPSVQSSSPAPSPTSSTPQTSTPPASTLSAPTPATTVAAAPPAPDAKKARESAAPAPTNAREPVLSSTPVAPGSTKPVIEIKPAVAAKPPVAARPPVDTKEPAEAVASKPIVGANQNQPSQPKAVVEAPSPIAVRPPSVEPRPGADAGAPVAAKPSVVGTPGTASTSTVDSKPIVGANQNQPSQPKPVVVETPSPVAARPSVEPRSAFEAGGPIAIKPSVVGKPDAASKLPVDAPLAIAARVVTEPKAVAPMTTPVEPASSVAGATLSGAPVVAKPIVASSKTSVEVEPVAGAKAPGAATQSVESRPGAEAKSIVDSGTPASTKPAIEPVSFVASEAVEAVEPASVAPITHGDRRPPSIEIIEFAPAVGLPAAIAPTSISPSAPLGATGVDADATGTLSPAASAPAVPPASAKGDSAPTPSAKVSAPSEAPPVAAREALSLPDVLTSEPKAAPAATTAPIAPTTPPVVASSAPAPEPAPALAQVTETKVAALSPSIASSVSSSVAPPVPPTPPPTAPPIAAATPVAPPVVAPAAAVPAALIVPPAVVPTSVVPPAIVEPSTASASAPAASSFVEPLAIESSAAVSELVELSQIAMPQEAPSPVPPPLPSAAPVSAENLASRRSIDWNSDETISEDVATPAWARGVVPSSGDESAPSEPLRDEPIAASTEDLVLSSIADVPIASASRRAAWLRFRKPIVSSWRSDGSDAAQGNESNLNGEASASGSDSSTSDTNSDTGSDAASDTGTHRRQVALLHPGSGFLGAALNELSDAPDVPRPRPVRRMPRMRININWKRTLAASVVVSLLEGVAFATAYWFATPTEPGSLLVETTPVGVEVLVDGRVSGKTPYSGSLMPGRHTIELRVGVTSRVIPVEISPGVQTMQRVLWSKGLKTGQARITSTPAGARVSIDGLAHGSTPLIVSTLAAGRHNVVIVSDSGTVSAPLSISPGETTEMDVPVFPGWVSVLAPVELQIYEGERLLGTTEGEKLLVAPGKHTLTFVSEPLGYRGSQTALVTPGATVAVSMVMPKVPVSVVGPSGAELFIDGEPAGALPIDSVRAVLGTRDFVIRHPQFGERRQAITVTQKAPARVVFD